MTCIFMETSFDLWLYSHGMMPCRLVCALLSNLYKIWPQLNGYVTLISFLALVDLICYFGTSTPCGAFFEVAVICAALDVKILWSRDVAARCSFF